MREILKQNLKIDFVSRFKVSSVISVVVVLMALLFILQKGLNYGVDFKGGAEVQVKFKEPVKIGVLRDTLKAAGHASVNVQSIGNISENEFLVKLQAEGKNLNDLTNSLTSTLNSRLAQSGPEIRKTDIVGPKAGAQLRVSGFQAMVWALLAIMIYISLRFDFKYSPGAIVALFHDVVIILGIFSFFSVEFTLQIVAALLAVIGYSVNDTVIVYDRVREHERKFTGKKLSQHINGAINETLSRTILTSGTTLFVSLAMYFFGGQSIKDFFLAISLGVLIGTYSSIFVAAPVTIFFNRFKFKFMAGNGLQAKTKV